jgi:hypothetical protein
MPELVEHHPPRRSDLTMHHPTLPHDVTRDESWHTRTPPRGRRADRNRTKDLSLFQIELGFFVKEIKASRIRIDKSLHLT